jgi:hypothetical protein
VWDQLNVGNPSNELAILVFTLSFFGNSDPLRCDPVTFLSIKKGGFLPGQREFIAAQLLGELREFI